jgi:hypothetical protein
MSRSGYNDDYDSDDDLAMYRYRGQVASAMRGKRGQRMLRELRDALDAMPVKRLVAGELETSDGNVCALGCLGRARGVDMVELDPEDAPLVAVAFDIAEQLAREVVYVNDEEACWTHQAGEEQRWQYMRNWVERHIRETEQP